MQEKQNRGVGPTCAVSEPGGQTQSFRVCLSVFVFETNVSNVKENDVIL